jgi:ribosomal protein S18 acetylase RimI-like enzyme
MIAIVKAEEEHVTAIGKLWWEFMEIHQQADAIFTPREGAIPGFQENYLRRFMRSENGLVLVALDGEKVIGYSLSEIMGPSPGFKREEYGSIDQMAITADYRKKGIGEKMFAIDRVEIQTASRNGMANSFWHKLGFEIFQYNLYKNIQLH